MMYDIRNYISISISDFILAYFVPQGNGGNGSNAATAGNGSGSGSGNRGSNRVSNFSGQGNTLGD
jgi:hypothetical protein